MFAFNLPDVGEGIAEAELIEWHVEVGDAVAEHALIATVMTEKVTVEVPSPFAGKVMWRCGDVGDILAVGAPLVKFDGATPLVTDVKQADPTPPHPANELHDGSPRQTTQAAPAVRRYARELGIDLSTITGTGPKGRVLRGDIDRHQAQGPSSLHPAPTLASPQNPTDAPDTVVPVRGLRRTIAKRLSAVNSDVPHITYVEEVDMTQTLALRDQFQRSQSLSLSPLPFIARAACQACRDFPQINATYDAEAQSVVQHSSVHLGIATQTERGLVVGVVKHADKRLVPDLASEITRVSGAAKQGRATREELSGSTLTITSLGKLGGIVVTPLINPPEVAILGINRIRTQPVWSNGTWLPREMMNISCSVDHRFVDGYDIAAYIQRLKEILEHPGLTTLS